MDLVTLAQPVALITMKKRNAVEEINNRTLKETRCHSWKMDLRSLIQVGLMYPPFWFSTLKSKKAMLILTGRKH